MHALLSKNFASELQSLARLAGDVILSHRTTSSLNTKLKPDGSQVTDADKNAERVILDGLHSLTPEIPVVAEEKDNPPHLASSKTYWLVDPLDSTENYINGGDEFSVNIGLIVDGIPYLGVVFAPAKDDLFFGTPLGAVRIINQQSIQIKDRVSTDIHTKNLITSNRESKKLPIEAWLRAGQIDSWKACSSAYKFGLLAVGETDIYLRTGTTYEWDTAAGDAIIRAVGGQILASDGCPLAYGKTDFRNGNFIAFGEPQTAPLASQFFTMLNQLKL